MSSGDVMFSKSVRLFNYLFEKYDKTELSNFCDQKSVVPFSKLASCFNRSFKICAYCESKYWASSLKEIVIGPDIFVLDDNN